MEYRPSQPKTNVNVSNKHPLKEFGSLLCGLLLLAVMIYVVLGLLIDITVDQISTDTELAIYETLKLSDISEVIAGNSNDSTEAANLLNALAPCADLSYPISLSVDASPEVNAYALPGGYMVVHQGLIDKLHTENGLAFVLAHEIAHFKNRDHLRSMGRNIVLLTGAILLTGNNSDLSNFFTPAMNYQSAQYSQSRESKADATALDILNCHYGSIEGATELFEYLKESEERNLLMSHYFSSHPETEIRIQKILESSYQPETPYQATP